VTELLLRVSTDNNGNYFYQTEESISLLNIIVPYGWRSDDNNGYAHLIEHLVIKNNKEYLSNLERHGVFYNASTTQDSTDYMFLSTSDILKTEINNGNILKVLFHALNESDLAAEINTIIQERLILTQQLTNSEIDRMIGKEEEIKGFNILKANAVLASNYKNIKTLNMNNEINFYHNNKLIFNKLWIYSANIVTMERHKDSVKIILERCYYSEMLAYFLRILICNPVGKGKVDIKRNSFEIEIEIAGDLPATSRLQDLKDKSHNYYLLTLNSIKALSEELKYIIKYLGIDHNLTYMYLNTNWEVFFFEKIISEKCS